MKILRLLHTLSLVNLVVSSLLARKKFMDFESQRVASLLPARLRSLPQLGQVFCSYIESLFSPTLPLLLSFQSSLIRSYDPVQLGRFEKHRRETAQNLRAVADESSRAAENVRK